MQVLSQVDLSDRNTLGVRAVADHFVEVSEADQIPELVSWAHSRSLPVRVLGGGSNLVLAPRIRGLVLGMAITGRRRINATNDGIEHWQVQAGESWHSFVRFSVSQGLSGWRTSR